VTKAYIVFAIKLHGAAVLDLFEVALRLICVTLRPPECGADGEGAVGKVDEHFAALQVVCRERVGRVALWGVGQHKDGQVVCGFEGLEVFHKGKRTGDVFGTAAQAGNVVDNEHGGAGFADAVTEGVGDEIVERFVLEGQAGRRVELGAVKVVVKAESAMLMMIVTQLELFSAQLEIDIEHAGVFGMCGKGADVYAAGNGVANLYGEDGFAGVSVGKQDAELVLLPEVAEEHLGVGRVLLECDPVVSSVRGEELLAVVGHLAKFAGAACAVGELLRFGPDHFNDEGAFEGRHF